MIDSSAVLPAVTNSISGGMALQGILIVAFLEFISLLKKYGPFVIAYFRRRGDPEPNASALHQHQCAAHPDLMATVKENTRAVKELTLRADKHHEEQRRDLSDLKEEWKNDLKDLCETDKKQGQEIAKHEMAISFLRERDQARSAA